jgi:hypothetical protein
MVLNQEGQSFEILTINTSRFNQGLHLLVAEDGNGYSFKSKLVIQ